MKGQFMRILVISDSHGRTSEIEKAIEAQPTAKNIFFLGDCVNDIEDLEFLYPDRIFHKVCGNCDFSSMLPSAKETLLNSVTIFFTHGHPYSVKSGIGRLKAEAKLRGAKLVLYGHTHISKIDYEEGIYFVNPGSLSSGREGGTSYAVIDIEPNGIMPIIVKT